MLMSSYDMRRKHASVYYPIKSFTILLVVLGIGSITYFNNHHENIRYNTQTFVLTVNETYNNATQANSHECHILSVPDADRCEYATNNTQCNHYIQLQYCQFRSFQPLFYVLAVCAQFIKITLT